MRKKGLIIRLMYVKKILFYVWMCVCLCVCAKGKNSRADFKKVLPFLPFNFS